MDKELYDIENEIKKILNSTNLNESIVLLSNDKTPIRFSKQGLILYKNKLYAILSPLDKINGKIYSDFLILKIIEKESGLNFEFPESERLENKIYKIFKKNYKQNLMDKKINCVDNEFYNGNFYLDQKQ